MKIGIVTFSIDARDGGSSTLIGTILDELQNDNKGYEIVYIYSDPSIKKIKFDSDGRHYINPSAYKRKHLLKMWEKQFSLLWNNIRNFFMLRPMSHTLVSAFDMIADEEHIDIYWFMAPVLELLATPYIYTVWDIGHRVFPYVPETCGSMSNWSNREQTYSEMLYRAAYILTGNETGKREILQNYPVIPDKIRILPFPVSSFCKGEETIPKKQIPESYYLYPAQFWPHKNHIRIIQAIKYLKENKNIQCNVVFTGSDKLNMGYIMGKAREYGISENVFNLGFVETTELKYLYTHAKALIFASLMGPNNIPPIEAIALDCPVIITGIEGHKEQLGDSALYFEGLSYESLAECVLKVENGIFPDDTSRFKAAELKKEWQDYDYAVCVFDILDEFQRYRELY